MLLRRLRAAPQLECFRETLQAIRFSSTASDGSGAAAAGEEEEMSKTGRDNRLRYLVVDKQADSPLDLLEKSFHRTPVIYPSAEGGKTRYLKLPPPQVCSKVLTAAAREPKLVARAAELADALQLQGVELGPNTLRALVEGLTKRGKVGPALAPLDHWLASQAEALESEEGDAGVRAEALAMLTGLVDASARAEDTRNLQQVLARMAKVGLMPTTRSVTSLLQCFMRLGQPQIAHSILEWMRRGGMTPNVFHYTTLMAMPRDLDVGGAARLLRQAQETYGRMQEDGVRPNTRFFTAYIRLCGRARDLDAALEAWQDMQALGIKPDLILYSALIGTCAKCQNPDTALQLFDSMNAHKVRPDVVTYASLLAALQGPPAQLGPARKVWAALREAGIEPNSFAVVAYLDILLQEGEVDEALDLLTEATQRLGSGGGSGRPSARGGGSGGGGGSVVQLARLYEHFMYAMASRGQYQVVEHLARHMRSRGVAHTLGSAAALLTSQALQRGVSTGRWLLHPEDSTQHAQQHHHQEGAGAHSMPSVPGAGASMAVRQLPLDLPEGLEEGCLLGKGSAAEYAERLTGSKVRMGRTGGSTGGRGTGPLTPAVLNLLLGSLAVQGEAGRAFELYDWAQLEGIKPDSYTLRLLMFAALNAPPDVQFDLLIRVLSDSRLHFPGSKQPRQQQPQGSGHSPGRRHGSGGSSGFWDHRTRTAILNAMRQSNKALELLGGAGGALQSAEQSEEMVRRVQAMLGRT